MFAPAGYCDRLTSIPHSLTLRRSIS